MKQQAFNEFMTWGKIYTHDRYVSNGVVICASEPDNNTWLIKVIEQFGQPESTQRVNLVVTAPQIDTFPACYVFGPDDWVSTDQLIAIDQRVLSAVIDTDEMNWYQDYLFGIGVFEGAYGMVPLVAVYSQFELLWGAVAALKVDAEMWTKILAYRALDR